MTETHFEVVQQESRKVKEEIIETLDEVEGIQLEVAKLARAKLIRGKPAEQWDKDLTVTIDYNADPVMIKVALEKINNCLNLVNRNLIIARQEEHLYKVYYSKQFNSKLDSEAAKKGRKLPSLSTMESLAESALGCKTLVKEAYQMEILFWESYMTKLVKQLQLLNQMAMNNGTMAKLEKY